MTYKVNIDMENKTYLVEELFEDIPDDPDNVILKFPPEVLEHTGWQEGDTLNVEIENGAIVISKV
jgi:formylmethanofuran dehydrogenase subunit D